MYYMGFTFENVDLLSKNDVYLTMPKNNLYTNKQFKYFKLSTVSGLKLT